MADGLFEAHSCNEIILITGGGWFVSRYKVKEKEFDEKVVKHIDSWEITCSPSNKCLYLDTTSYQTFKLKLTRGDLQELMDLLDREVQKG